MQPDFTVNTPFANLGVRVEQGCIVGIQAVADSLVLPPQSVLDKKIARQLNNYCERQTDCFDVPLKLRGTAFQKKVWRELRRIPPGKVMTYGELAQKLRTSPRAVGNACRRNPVLLMVPCHRVVSASGLGGFAGKTRGKWPDMKRRLLQHEGVMLG